MVFTPSTSKWSVDQVTSGSGGQMEPESLGQPDRLTALENEVQVLRDLNSAQNEKLKQTERKFKILVEVATASHVKVLRYERMLGMEPSSVHFEEYSAQKHHHAQKQQRQEAQLLPDAPQKDTRAELQKDIPRPQPRPQNPSRRKQPPRQPEQTQPNSTPSPTAHSPGDGQIAPREEPVQAAPLSGRGQVSSSHSLTPGDLSANSGSPGEVSSRGGAQPHHAKTPQRLASSAITDSDVVSVVQPTRAPVPAKLDPLDIDDSTSLGPVNPPTKPPQSQSLSPGLSVELQRLMAPSSQSDEELDRMLREELGSSMNDLELSPGLANF